MSRQQHPLLPDSLGQRVIRDFDQITDEGGDCVDSEEGHLILFQGLTLAQLQQYPGIDHIAVCELNQPQADVKLLEIDFTTGHTWRTRVVLAQ